MSEQSVCFCLPPFEVREDKFPTQVPARTVEGPLVTSLSEGDREGSFSGMG